MTVLAEPPTADESPIACTLAPGALQDRLAAIAALMRDGLRHYERRDLILDLRYATELRERVREMVRGERACCGFLAFDLRETPNDVRLIITAPETAREVADTIFEQFVSAAPSLSQSACSCAPRATLPAPEEPHGARTAGVTAATVATAAVACAACCVLPFALPAAMLASVGGVLAWFDHIHVWVTRVAIFAVIASWLWIGWQTARTRRKPSVVTLYVMGLATALMIVAMLWPLIEPHLIRALRT